MASRHERSKDLFLAALACQADRRAAFLDEACGADTALRAEVASLLAFHEESQSGTPSSSGKPPQSEKDRFAPGDVFAGRYRMVTRIGRGGMGDVWRADDLVLETPVALKLIHATGPDARTRILNEVRLARQITHPSVCRVFDVGEADGLVFFSMALVNGEDLASVIRRVGRLPSERVVEIGRQLCAGLEAAHARGVLHRDLKPGNVLIDNRGSVRITDFGIAVMQTESGRHTLVGTPGYMAPEQLSRDGALSERTDVYALGVVLYELVTGRHPSDRGESTAAPARPSTLVSDVNLALERVILQALSPDANDRPSSAAAMGAALSRIGPPHDADRVASHSTRRKSVWVAVTGLAVVLGALAVTAALLLPSRASGLTEQDTIVLADIANTTGEPVFDGALKVALAVALEQSPFLRVFPDERVRETLRLMERSADERLTPSVAREIAQREQLKALITGSIGSLGRNYVIALEAINAATGDVMAREQVEAPGKEQVLTSLGTLASRLREKLGESLVSVQKFDVPLARATTSSLQALQAYSLALDQGRIVPNREVIPHLKRAIELDPEFALAYALLSGIYANTGQTGLAPPFALRAFELRDRVSERERFFISWRYYHDATLAMDKAFDLTQSWMATYPREAFAFNSFGISAQSLGRLEQAVEPFREAIRLDPKYFAPYSNLGGVFLALNRFDDARALVQQAADEHVDFVSIREVSYLLALLDGDRERARQIETSVAASQSPYALAWQPRALAFDGRLEAADLGFRRGIQVALSAGLREVAAHLTVEASELHASVGQCADIGRDVAAGLALSRDPLTLAKASRALALCGGGSEASKLSAELSKRFPEATPMTHVGLPVTAAAIAINRGEADRALELLEPVRPYDHAPDSQFWPAYLRGLASLARTDGRAAGAEFQSIIDHRGESADSVLYPLAHLGGARAATLAGDAAGARQAYDTFFALWKDADADLRPLREARAEYARLR